jgi:hypothetical protein
MSLTQYYDPFTGLTYELRGHTWVAIRNQENSMSRAVTVTCENKNVNSKKLFALIKDTLSQVCDEYIIIRNSIVDHTYDYSQLAIFADLFMEDLAERKMITQYDVLCDERNNDDMEVRHGNIKMELKFRQMNCLNVTTIKLHFHIGR